MSPIPEIKIEQMGKEYTGSGESVIDRSRGADTIIPPFHILVIRLSAMGDVAMTVPVLSALASQYPRLKITVLTKGFFGPIFNGLPNVSVYEADVRGRHNGVMG